MIERVAESDATGLIVSVAIGTVVGWQAGRSGVGPELVVELLTEVVSGVAL